MQKISLSKGFTLIELLVVIAILGILAAVVLVAINPAARIAEANDSGKKSDLGQVAVALEACYTQSGGTYAGCYATATPFDTTPLKTGGFLKNTVANVSVKASTVTGEAIAYVQLAAPSNITGGSCTSPNVPFMVYRTSTGATGNPTAGANLGKAECYATTGPTS